MISGYVLTIGTGAPVYAHLDQRRKTSRPVLHFFQVQGNCAR